MRWSILAIKNAGFQKNPKITITRKTLPVLKYSMFMCVYIHSRVLKEKHQLLSLNILWSIEMTLIAE